MVIPTDNLCNDSLMTPTQALITVVYKNYEVLYDFIECFRNQAVKNTHLIICDASPEKKNIDISNLDAEVLSIENKGYAHGVNVGIKKSQEKGIKRYCVINDDVIFEANFTERLSQAFDNHPNTAFGGKIYYAPGYEYHKDRYQTADQGNVIWYAGGEINWAHATAAHTGVDEVDTGRYDTESATQFITGCLFCFDQSVVDKAGMWDEQYFLYYEDTDYSVRITKKEIPLVYDPSIVIWHKNAQSSDGSGSDLHVRLQKKSHLRFALKFAPLRTKLHVLKNYFI